MWHYDPFLGSRSWQYFLHKYTFRHVIRVSLSHNHIQLKHMSSFFQLFLPLKWGEKVTKHITEQNTRILVLRAAQKYFLLSIYYALVKWTCISRVKVKLPYLTCTDNGWGIIYTDCCLITIWWCIKEYLSQIIPRIIIQLIWY